MLNSTSCQRLIRRVEKSAMSKKILRMVFCCLITSSVLSQNITNTLGTSGVFTIKDGTNDYLSISQSTGQMNILKTLRLENTTSSTTGVIYKGINRFIHNYCPSGSYNTFMGINAGNFTLTENFNTGIGYSSLSNLTTGERNTAVGSHS